MLFFYSVYFCLKFVKLDYDYYVFNNWFFRITYDSFSLKKLPTHKKITSYDLAPSKSAGPPERQDADVKTGTRHILAD